MNTRGQYCNSCEVTLGRHTYLWCMREPKRKEPDSWTHRTERHMHLLLQYACMDAYSMHARIGHHSSTIPI